MDLDEAEWGIAANVARDDHHFFRRGARVWIVNRNTGNASDRVEVRGLSHGGRFVTAWIDVRHLDGCRAKWMPVHLRPSMMGGLSQTREEAEKRASVVGMHREKEGEDG